jgi:hypothetical protein
LSCLCPDRLAYNHQPGGDPNANLQWHCHDRRSSNRIDNRKGSTNSAFGIRLMPFRPAEVDEDAITYIPGDETSKAGDGRGHAGLVATRAVQRSRVGLGESEMPHADETAIG